MGDRLYKKPGGTVWYGSYYGPDGQRRQVCTKQQDRAAARAVLRQLEREAQTALGAAADAGGTGYTIGTALEDFLDHGCLNVAPKTEEMYFQKAGHVLRLLGGHDVGKLTLDDVNGYVRTRLDEGAARETVKKELVTLRRALTVAKERKLSTVEPATVVPKLRSRYVPRERFLSEDEFVRLMASMVPERRLWVLLAVYTGARASEVEGIRWDHVNLERGLVLLPGTKTEKARRWIPIAPPLRAALEKVDPKQRTGCVVAPWHNVRMTSRYPV